MQIRSSIYPLVGRGLAPPAPAAPATELNGAPLVLSLPERVDVVTMFSIEGLLTDRTLLDRYRVGEVLGRGGMGVVYRARDLKLDRDVALKVLTLASPDPQTHQQLRTRLAREARIAAGIQHPNVVSVYDHGTDPSLRLDFLTMELLEGEDLARRLHRLGLPRLSSALTVIREAAAGLAAGHRAGLVHRDVKPGNLFLPIATSSGAPQVKVLDFGIAQGAVDADWTLTQASGALGEPLSPAFASPEQLRGGVLLSPASDVFSLGAVAYNLFTGRRLFRTPDPDLMMREIEQSLTLLREEDSLPPKLATVLEKALSAQPDARFPNAGALLASLDATIDHSASAVSISTDFGHPAVQSTGEGGVPPSYAAAVVGGQPTPAAAGRSPTEPARRGFVSTVLAGLLALSWIFGSTSLPSSPGVALVALGSAGILAPWLAVRITKNQVGLRFSILATLAITLLALGLLGGDIDSVQSFAGVGIAQLIMAGLASWLSGRPADPDIRSPASVLPTERW